MARRPLMAHRSLGGIALAAILLAGALPAPVAAVHTAVDDDYEAVEDASLSVPAPGVLTNDTPSVGLEAANASDPAHGSVSLAADGSFAYTPDPDFNGSDTFTYDALVLLEPPETATVTITVQPANDPPSAAPDAAALTEDDPATVIDVLANDSSAPDTGETLSITAVTQGAKGSVASGPSALTYTPAPNADGADSSTYTIADGNGGGDSATVSVTIAAVNDPPDAVDDELSLAEDLGASTLHPRVVVLQRGIATAGTHTLEVRVVGDGRVDVDAFVVLH